MIPKQEASEGSSKRTSFWRTLSEPKLGILDAIV